MSKERFKTARAVAEAFFKLAEKSGAPYPYTVGDLFLGMDELQNTGDGVIIDLLQGRILNLNRATVLAREGKSI